MASNTQIVYTSPEAFLRERNQMVEHDLRGRDISDPRVLEAMLKIPRHRFVPERDQKLAYEDFPLGLPCGQTISQPYMVAKMAELLELTGDERVLEIGAGSGYQAAVLGLLAREVYAIEWFPELAEIGRANLEGIGLANVHVRSGDGKDGWPEGAPYDRILISCAIREVLPAWEEQLAPGGLLVFPRQCPDQDQLLYRWTKTATGWGRREEIFNVRFVPLL